MSALITTIPTTTAISNNIDHHPCMALATSTSNKFPTSTSISSTSISSRGTKKEDIFIALDIYGKITVFDLHPVIAELKWKARKSFCVFLCQYKLLDNYIENDSINTTTNHHNNKNNNNNINDNINNSSNTNSNSYMLEVFSDIEYCTFICAFL